MLERMLSLMTIGFVAVAVVVVLVLLALLLSYICPLVFFLLV